MLDIADTRKIAVGLEHIVIGSEAEINIMLKYLMLAHDDLLLIEWNYELFKPTFFMALDHR